MKLWDKGFKIEQKIEDFTVGDDRELDLKLAKYDVLGSVAHAKMLQSIDIISKDELTKLEAELAVILKEIEAGNFVIEDNVEDVHSQVELMLTKKLGDIGKKIHSGRSRNDQVLVDLKLFMREELYEITQVTKELFDKLISVSNKYKDVLIPGYTHFQVAMPSSIGLWLGAYAESLVDDLEMLQAAFKVVNQNPLGSAAGYGTSFPLNRTMTTELLGFKDLNYNVIAAQMGRGKTELLMSFGLSSIATTLSKLAMDVCVYNSQNFGFISFPDALTTGSSIMPHKKNPDVFELIRAKCNKIKALPTELQLTISNLPSGYHRDFQILKENFFPAIETLKDCLDIASFMFSNIIVNENVMDDEKYKYVYSVEEVNKEVLAGLPFRDAYKKVGDDIQNGTYNPDHKVYHTHEGSIGNLCNDKIQDKMNETLSGFNFSEYKDALKFLVG